MKYRYRIFVYLFLVVLIKSTSADVFTLNLLFTEGEKSKDSWSKTTKITIDGNEISLNESRSGRAKETDKVKVNLCTFSEDDLKKIQDLLATNKLVVKDSLIDEDTKYKSFEHFCNISLDIAYSYRIGKIRINGDISNFEKKELYMNVKSLFDMLYEMANKC